MKTLLVSFLIILSSSENILFSQEQLKPFVISPFIGEKLDCVEESYFNLFPGVPSFNEAILYLDADSTLFINVQFYENNLLKDTLILSTRSPQYLTDRINEVLLKDINEGRVKELEFITENKEKYEGTVYSFNDEQIKLIEDRIRGLETDIDLTRLNYSELKTVTKYESSTTMKIAFSLLGLTIGGLIGAALAPEPEPEIWSDIYTAPLEAAIPSILIGMGVGGITGFIIGSAIKVPINFEMMDPEAKKIIRDNSLLPSGL